MCNAIAFRLHVRPGGDEVILDRTSHPVNYEAGGPAALSGAMLRVLDGDGGIFSAAQVEEAVRPAGDRYGPRSRLVSVEQTTNIGGGRVWPLRRRAGACSTSRARHGLRTHLDGARLMNAVVASGVSAADFAGGFDTAWIDFTKGLGAPVGAVLAGSRELIDEAWRYKQMIGGAMRQAGIVAAAGLYALDHHVERLAADHANARRLAEALAELPGVDIDLDRVETNIVVFGVPDAFALCGALLRARRPGQRRSARSACAPSPTSTSTPADIDRALTRVSSSCWLPERAPDQLRGEEQDQAGEADLERALGDVVRDHRARDHAERREHPDHDAVPQPHVAVAVLAPGADERDRHDRDQRGGLGLELGLVEEDRRAPGTNRMPPPTPTRPPTAPARKPEQDGGELAQPISSSIATATSSAANMQRHGPAGEALLERGAGDHARHRGHADQQPLADVDVAVQRPGRPPRTAPISDDRGQRRAGRLVLAVARTTARAAARSRFRRRPRTAR